MGLAQAAGYPLNSRFQGLLADLDAAHQGDPPPAATSIGNSPDELLDGLRSAVEQMIQLGGDAFFLRVVLHRARSTPQSR